MAARLLTRREKETIRNSPCGRCGKRPPFSDGSRCHPHRIIPGCVGGRYTKENTTPRCPECHDIEHGGTGEAPFIGAAHQRGVDRMRRLGPKGRRALARAASRAACEKITTEQRQKWGRLSGRVRRLRRPKLRKVRESKIARRRRAQMAALRLHEVRPTLRYRLGQMQVLRLRGNRKQGQLAAHVRWHQKRGVRAPGCLLCQ